MTKRARGAKVIRHPRNQGFAGKTKKEKSGISYWEIFLGAAVGTVATIAVTAIVTKIQKGRSAEREEAKRNPADVYRDRLMASYNVPSPSATTPINIYMPQQAPAAASPPPQPYDFFDENE